MTEELAQLMKNLHLIHMSEIFPQQLRCAEKDNLSYSDFLERLLRPEWHSRQQHSLQARIHRARLPELWTLETFPYAKQPGVQRRQIRAFAELDFRVFPVRLRSAKKVWATWLGRQTYPF